MLALLNKFEEQVEKTEKLVALRQCCLLICAAMIIPE
jgi:hypothetical protein